MMKALEPELCRGGLEVEDWSPGLHNTQDMYLNRQKTKCTLFYQNV